MMLLASTELWYHGQDKQTVPLPAPTHYHNALEQARRWYDVQDKEIGTHPPDIKFPAFVAIVHVTDNLVWSAEKKNRTRSYPYTWPSPPLWPRYTYLNGVVVWCARTKDKDMPSRHEFSRLCDPQCTYLNGVVVWCARTKDKDSPWPSSSLWPQCTYLNGVVVWCAKAKNNDSPSRHNFARLCDHDALDHIRVAQVWALKWMVRSTHDLHTQSEALAFRLNE